MRLVRALAATLLLAGCGTPATPEVPRAQRPPTEPAASGSATPANESDYDKALRYVRCVNDKSGTRVDRNGQFVPAIRIADPVVGEPLPVYVPRDVFDQCKQFLPALWPVHEDPANIAANGPFRACLREHGIDAPEPDSSGLIAYSTDPYMEDDPAYRAAEDACIGLYVDTGRKQ